MVSTRARSLENQPESSTAPDEHNTRLQQLNDQIREREQQLAILHAQQRLKRIGSADLRRFFYRVPTDPGYRRRTAA
ncbi:predicted protein [Histoplasma mississippiense (nom. inval.)]|uniref:predicted protein n=1 Tax=Ajellomyces capsulatus (strain NAm1 / WU24) TaxID=2059318 RepID=UPI000157C36B|nr:predicted protein [Histoplasma mississippiense (nom. inval.)]EDN07261.1 predicted protein [Histoplasma mississippiense (nom. inval.)]